MLSERKVSKVRELLALGKSQREASWKSGVSRGRVAAIANGTRPDYAALRKARKQVDWMQPAGPYVRCDGCGGKTQMPCIVCAARDKLRPVPRETIHAMLRTPLEPLGVELSGAERRRYEEVRRKHIRKLALGELEVEEAA